MTQEEFIKRTAANVSRQLIKEGYGDLDKKWSDLGKGIRRAAHDAANGVEHEPTKHKGTLGDYVADNFGQDKGYGMKKLGRQIKRGTQVALAGAGTAGAIAGGTAIHKTKELGNKTKELGGKARGLLQRFIGESNLHFDVPQEYTHFAVRKSDKHIVNGWDYSDHDYAELNQFKRDYFTVDLEDMGLDAKKFKIMTVRGCKNAGIDPFDPTSWDNTTESDCA